MVNLFFAGLLAWFYPILDTKLGGTRLETDDRSGGGGALGLFAGFNAVAFVLVFLLVEETKQRSLEDLEQIYNISKRRFATFQATVQLPWFLKRWLLGAREEKPDFYDDSTKNVTSPDEEMMGPSPPGSPVGVLAPADRWTGDVVLDDRPGSRSRYE